MNVEAQVRCLGCVCRWRLTPWRCQDKAMIRAGVACGGGFVVQAVRNLWVVDVVFGTEMYWCARRRDA